MTAGESPSHEKGQPGLVQAALSGLCPRCGEPTLFEAPASVAFECRHCRLDFTRFERGGRLAGLLTLIIAAALIAIGIGIDIALDPPLWLQALVWAPVTVLAVIGSLRFYKTALLHRQYDKQTGKDAN